MDDDGVVDLLRAAGHGGQDASPADVHRAMAAGTKIRRRRQAMQVVGSGLAIVAVLGVGITAVGALDDNADRTTVGSRPDEPDPVKQGVPTSVTRLGDFLAEDLGVGWVNAKGDVTLTNGSELASRLPEGDYTASAGAQLINQAAFNQVCGQKKGTAACQRIDTADGPLWLWDWADRDAATSEFRGETSAYRKLADDRYVLIVVSVVGENVTAQQRESHIDTVGSWFASVEEPLRKAVTDKRIENSLAPADYEPVYGAGYTASRSGDFLVEDMGPGWANAASEVVLDPRSELASRLPGASYTARVTPRVISQAAFDAVCGNKPGVVPCTEHQTEGGKRFFLWSWADYETDSPEVKGESVAYRPFGHGQYLLVGISILSREVPAEQGPAHVDGVKAGFASLEGRLITAVTDDRLLASSVTDPEEGDAGSGANSISHCNAVPAPPQDREYDSTFNPETGFLTLTFEFNGQQNFSYTIDTRNDPTCTEDPRMKQVIESSTQVQ
jgi:hypothetical protein